MISDEEQKEQEPLPEIFDYTEWRQTLFEDMTIEDIIKDAKKFAIDFRKIKGNI